MSIIEIKMKNIYGLNNFGDFDFTSNERHNFIYGINAIGKSSVSKGVGLISENKEYHKLMDMDSENYSMNFAFDDINECMNNSSPFFLNNKNINQRVYMFNKTYLSKNVVLVNSNDSSIQVGLRIAEREKYINDIDDIYKKVQESILDRIAFYNMKTNNENFFEISNILKLKSSSKDKAKERLSKKEALETLLSSYNENINFDITILDTSDFDGKNLKIFKEISNFLLKLSSDYKKVVIKEVDAQLYLINNLDDKNFYNNVLNYLETNGSIDRCPICKNENFDINDIIKNIRVSFENQLNEENLKEFNSLYEKLIENSKSYLHKNIKKIYNDLLKKNFNIIIVNEIINIIDELSSKYDTILLKYIDYSFKDEIIKEYYEKQNLIIEINTQNFEYSENDEFIQKFNDMLVYILEDENIKSEKLEYQEKGINYYGIQLLIDGKMKKGISIQDYWNEILSESQKTKISLAFMFSVVIFNNYNGKILCVFDDPIDSYDSINKYKMSRIIYEFIEKKDIFENYSYDCYDIIFSHSIEFLRLFKDNYIKTSTSSVKYWIMKSYEIEEINENELYLLTGDYNILNEILINQKKSKKPISTEIFIALLPIIRELASKSRKIFDWNNKTLKIGSLDIKNLDTYISVEVIHGYWKNSELNSIISNVENYIEFDVTKTKDKKQIFNYIKDFIDKNIINIEKMSFHDQIFFKNIMAIYVRAKFDYELTNAIKKDIAKYKTASLEDINDNLWEISKKLSVLCNDSVAKKNNLNLMKKINKCKPMLNDFIHSANIFLTPLIDITAKTIKVIYEEIK